MFGIPRNYSAAIRAIREGHTFLQDVGEITYEESKFKQTRHVANVAGGGLDAHTIKIFNHQKAMGRKGKSLYLMSLVRAFFSYKSPGVKVWVDDKLAYNDLLFSFAIGICKYNGGGIQQLPAAVADDGLFDITLIRPVHWWHIVFRLKKLFNGKIYEIGHVQHLQGSRIRVEASPEMPLEVDGELLGHTPLNFNILHRAVRVVVNKDFLE
jgi:diacylglycerol kinase family enzyme